MGFIEETGIAQHMRDARVLAIYEGTNGIQANDLVFRKMARDNGAAFNQILAEIEKFLPELGAHDEGKDLKQALGESLAALRDAGTYILATAKSDAALAAATAAPFLRLAGNVLGGFYLFKTARLAMDDLKAGSGNAGYMKAKILGAQFYAAHVLPLSTGLAATVKNGGKSVLMADEKESFL